MEPVGSSSALPIGAATLCDRVLTKLCQEWRKVPSFPEGMLSCSDQTGHTAAIVYKLVLASCFSSDDKTPAAAPASFSSKDNHTLVRSYSDKLISSQTEVFWIDFQGFRLKILRQTSCPARLFCTFTIQSKNKSFTFNST